MPWAAVLRMRDGSEQLAGVHPTFSGAHRQAEDLNRRYQADLARVEVWDRTNPLWPDGHGGFPAAL